MEEKATNIVSFIITDDQSHSLYSERFKATYHSTRGAVSECKHVFIQNGLQHVKEQFNLSEISILEIGFGTGLNAFETYLFAKEQNLKINYHTIEGYPILMEDVLKLNYINEFSKYDRNVFYQLHELEWNKVNELTDFFSFNKQKVLLEEFVSSKKFNLIYFDAFSPSEQPELWTEVGFKNMFDLLKNNGTLVTYCAQGQMKRNMKNVGFKVQSLPGALGKREMTRGIKTV